MKKIFTYFGLLASLTMFGQYNTYEAQRDSWVTNYDETLSSIREETAVTGGGPGGGQVTITTTYTDLDIPSNVTSLCFESNYLYVASSGLIDTVGGMTPETPLNSNWIYKFPTNPEEASVKTEASLTGAIGVMVNGAPFFGLNDAQSWSVSEDKNSYGGDGHWNQEAYYSEGHTLDSRYSAHTPPSGQYHSHATPFRLYEDYSSAVHSPIVGWANDGFPIYGPYGYTYSDDENSAVILMVSGYSLRNIAERNKFSSTGNVLPPALQGPDVSDDFPLGMYIEDYEFLDNQGTLDTYNGRWTKTPEFPDGIYAYFITQDMSSVPQFPYIVGTEFYGTPESANIEPNNTTIPSGAVCNDNLITAVNDLTSSKFKVYPNPTTEVINIEIEGDYSFEVTELNGGVLNSGSGVSDGNLIVDFRMYPEGIYLLKVVNDNIQSVSRIVVAE